MSLLSRVYGMVLGERKDLETGELISREQLLQSANNAYERPDPTPMAPPIGYKREPSMMERVREMMLKGKIERLREELGAETAEEAEDFDIPDEDEFVPSSEYEHDRHDMELLMAYEKLQAHRQAMDAKYGTTTSDANIDAAKKAANDAAVQKAKAELQDSGGAGGAKPPA